MAKTDLTAQRLRELLSYDPDTGFFEWHNVTGRKLAGAFPGCLTPSGYRNIGIDYCIYPAHHLAWLYMHGTLPVKFIDHLNGSRSDNRISNLRPADYVINNQNRRAAACNNPTRLLGVGRRLDGKYIARIMARGEKHFLGVFDSAELAHETYLKAKRRLHEACTI